MKFDFRILKDLNTRAVAPMVAPLIQPYTKYVYWFFSGILALLFLSSFTILPNIASFILAILLIFVAFIGVRMLCEFLVDYPYPVTSLTEEEPKKEKKKTK
ncbi:MAG: hypothetical protein EOM53_00305 [Alphaproteobacteria bacterium]|nr:hypothetical protein [Alphaproteobacteria bacterium]